MATPIGYTLGALLCGSLPDLTTAVVRSIVTSDNNYYGRNFLSEITPSSNNFTSSIYNTQFVRDTDSTFSSSSGVYLSASSTQFSNITSTFYDGSNYYYIYNYIDTGVASTSNMISYQQTNTTIQGPTNYKINNNKILFFTDTADNTRFTYRYFNELLIKDSAGSLQNATIGVALLSTSYTRDINHTSYTDISAHIIAQGTTSTYVTNGPYYADLKPLSSFTPLLATQTGTGGSVVFYLNPSSTPSSRTLVCALSGPQVNYNTTSAELVYFKAYQNIIMRIE
jgi:hypothetical protein